MNTIDQLRVELGTAPDAFEFNENFFRWGKDKEFWAVGKKFTHEDKEYEYISAGNWKNSLILKLKSWDKDEERKSQSFRKKIIKESKLLNSKVSLEEEEKNLAAKEKARAEYDAFKDTEIEKCPYVIKKKITHYGDVKKGANGELIIPTLDELQEVCGYQIVNLSGKWFQKGQRMKGVYFPIGDIKNAEVIYMAEGYATACTIHDATGLPVVVSFNSGNITRCVDTVRRVFGYKNIVIAADIDAKKAGEIGARKASKHPGVQYILPKFGDDDLSELSDFNDVHAVYGLDETKRQLEFDESKFNHVSFLGHSEGKFYFYSERAKEVSSLTAPQMRSGDLTSLALNEYWALNFSSRPNDDKDCDWIKTTDKIIDTQQSTYGKFNSSKLRGFGVWQDGKDVVFNAGDFLYKNGEKVDFGYVNSKYFYTPSPEHAMRLEPFNFNSLKKLSKALSLVDFKTEKDYMLFLGFIAQSAVFSCLDNWKSQMWLVAPAGSGKSTMLKFLQDLLSNSILFQNSTPAGIRQSLKTNALVSVVDEAEGESKKTKLLVEMAREAASGQSANVARGTTDGRGTLHNMTTVFCFGSIMQPQLTEADETRFANIHLKPKKNSDFDREKERKDLFHDCKSLGPQLMQYMIDNLSIYRESIDKVRELFVRKGATARTGDQYSNLVAGYWMLTQEKELSEIVDDFLAIDDSALERRIDSNEQIIDKINTLKLRDGNQEFLLGDYIRAVINDNHRGEGQIESTHAMAVLKLFRIKVVKEFVHFGKNDSLRIELQKIEVPSIWSVFQNDKENFECSNFKMPGEKKIIRSYKTSIDNFL